MHLMSTPPFLATWVAWVIYWSLSGWGRLKPIERRESSLERLSHILPIAVAIILYNLPPSGTGFGGQRILPWTFVSSWTGYGVTLAALLFTVVARRSLGGNWSGTVTLKQDHTLVQAGPYRWIRHPIYTGLIVALAGSAYAENRFQALLGFVIVVVALVVKLWREERWMGERFGADYAHYRRGTWALFPWIF